MNKNIGFNSIKTKLSLLITALVFFVCLSLGYLSYYQSSNACMAVITSDLQARAESTAGIIASKIDSDLNALDTVAEKEALKTLDRKKILEILPAECERLGYIDMEVFGLNGDLIVGSGKGVNISNLDYFKQALLGQSAISNPIVGNGSGNLEIMNAVPIKDIKGAIIGVVVARVEADRFYNKITSFKIGKSGYAFMLDKEGYIIAHPEQQMVLNQENMVKNNTDPQLKELVNLHRRMISGEKGWGQYTYKGITKLMVFAPVGVNNWSVGLCAPKNELLISINKLTISIMVITVIILILAAVVSFLIGSTIVRPISLVAFKAEKLAGGDFSQPVQEKYLRLRDEIGKLSRSFQKMIDNIGGLIKEVQLGSESLAAASQQISVSTQQISTGTQGEAKLVQQATQSMVSIMGGASKVVDSASSALEIAGRVTETSNEGEKSIRLVDIGMSRIDEKMKQLSKISGQIDEILGVINDISEQTNLLSLNATIEAARAGEHGRGFAVVAEEVRKLAERSGSATKDISKLIKVIKKDILKAVEATHEGSAKTVEAQQGFKKIYEMVQHNNEMVRNMSISAQNAAERVEDVTKLVESISVVTEETVAGIEEIAASAEEMASMAENLQITVQKFKV